MHTWLWMLLSSLGLGVCYAANVPPIVVPTNGIEISSSIIDALSYRQNDTNVGSDSGKHIKIVGGSDAKPGDAPWQVYLTMKQAPDANGNIGSIICGGTLLSKRVVVTAAHCLLGGTSRDATVKLGGLDRTNMPQTFGVKQQFVHEQYSSTLCGAGRTINCAHDIAVLILDKDATLDPISSATPSAQIAHLPLPEANDANYVGDDVLVSGWGITKDKQPIEERPTKLQKAVIKLMSQADCSKVYPDAAYNQQLMICAGTPPKYGISPCRADSGGPLVYTGNGNKANILFGIVSWTGGCETFPHVFTRVTSHVIWIKEKACLGNYCLPA